MVSHARHIGTFLLCRHLGTLLAKAAKRAPSQISCLGWIDVHAGDKVNVGAEKIFLHDVAHADGGVDD